MSQIMSYSEPGVVAHTWNHGTGDVEAGGSEGGGHPQQFETCLGHMGMRLKEERNG